MNGEEGPAAGAWRGNPRTPAGGASTRAPIELSGKQNIEKVEPLVERGSL